MTQYVKGNGRNETLSKVIDYLRFPLIVGVVFIHNYSLPDVKATPMLYYVSTFFSDVIPRISVPLFFFIAGFLFFYNVNTFSTGVYLSKLKKRFRTLVIPYVFWNLLFLCVYFLLQETSLANYFFGEYKFKSLFEGFICSDGRDGTWNSPIQLWFLRDLIFCTILSPILFIIITKTRHFGLIILGIGWYLGYVIPYIGYRGLSTVALFFFTFGAWFSCHRISPIEVARDFKLLVFLYPVIAIADLLTKGESFNIYIHNAGILCGILGCFLVAAYLVEKKNIVAVPLLTASSFFIYAIHMPWIMSQCSKIIWHLFHPESDLALTACYFVLVALAVVLSVGIYYVVKRLLPSFTALITGGRI